MVLLLDGSSSLPESYFDNMKSFARAFISKANIGPHLTQVSVIQYGSINTIDVPWNVPQERAHLQSLVDLMQQEGGPSHIGNALAFAVRYVTSEIHGARPGASKAVVIVVMDTSWDSVDIAAEAARSNRKCPAHNPETPLRRCRSVWVGPSFLFFFLEVVGIEPRALYTSDKHSAAELGSQALFSHSSP